MTATFYRDSICGRPFVFKADADGFFVWAGGKWKESQIAADICTGSKGNATAKEISAKEAERLTTGGAK